jgi:hypothetical protein
MVGAGAPARLGISVVDFQRRAIVWAGVVRSASFASTVEGLLDVEDDLTGNFVDEVTGSRSPRRNERSPSEGRR